MNISFLFHIFHLSLLYFNKLLLFEFKLFFKNGFLTFIAELNASLSNIVCKSIKGTWNGSTYDISNTDLGVTDCTEYVWAISLVGSTDGSQYTNLVWLSTVNTNKIRIRQWTLNNANNGTITVLQGSHGSEIFQVLGIKKR